MVLGTTHAIGAEVSSLPAAAEVVDAGVVKPDAVFCVLAAHSYQGYMLRRVVVIIVFTFLHVQGLLHVISSIIVSFSLVRAVKRFVTTLWHVVIIIVFVVVMLSLLRASVGV